MDAAAAVIETQVVFDERGFCVSSDIISVNYYDIYYAGDTQIIPEMATIHPDIAILPIDGNGTLTVHDAVEVVKEMRPRWVIPCNWGAGNLADARLFKKEIGGRAEVILPPLVE